MLNKINHVFFYIRITHKGTNQESQHQVRQHPILICIIPWHFHTIPCSKNQSQYEDLGKGKLSRWSNLPKVAHRCWNMARITAVVMEYQLTRVIVGGNCGCASGSDWYGTIAMYVYMYYICMYVLTPLQLIYSLFYLYSLKSYFTNKKVQPFLVNF